MKKNFLSLFIAEVISKILHENEIDKPLFSFVWKLKESLVKSIEINPNFPLRFLRPIG